MNTKFVIAAVLMAAALTGIFSTSTMAAYAQVDDLIYDIFGPFLDRLDIKTPDPPDIDLPEQLGVSVEYCVEFLRERQPDVVNPEPVC